MIQLDVIAGSNKGASFQTEESSFVIGRARTNRIILLDNKVSAGHAQIERRHQTYCLRDLNSTNGTFVNGRAITTEAKLAEGDEIRLGQTVLRVKAIAVSPASQAANVSLSDAAALAPSPVHARVPRTQTAAVLQQPSADTATPGLIEAYRNLLAMYKVSSIIRSGVGGDKLLDEVLAQVFRNFRAERGVIMLYDDDGTELVPRAFRTRGGGPPETEMVISRTIANEVIESQEAILTTDATLDERFNPAESIVQQHIRSAMCAPISAKNRPLGIIYVDCRTEAGTFKKADLELLTAIGNEAGVAVENQILRQANLKAERLAAVGQTVAGLSHYVKNVLTCMEAGSDIITRGLKESDLGAIGKGWGVVSRNERRISELVLDMLNYSTERKPARAACDLNNVIEDVAETIGPTAEAAGVRLELELDPELSTVPADPNGVHRCVLNLLTNALDAVEGADDPKVTVATGRRDDHVFFQVTDNGGGIPADVRDKIFDVFVSTKGEGGTGLGLAVVKKIVNEHAGEVSVESEPGQGARFTVAFPTQPPSGY